MNNVAPLGPVYQAGTLAGNPLAMRAGIAALEQLTKSELYEEMTQLARRLVFGLRANWQMPEFLRRSMPSARSPQFSSQRNR